MWTAGVTEVSTYQAISGVTQTLKSLLKNQMKSDPKPDVSCVPPDVRPESAVKRVNLYLYKITENAYLKNLDMPDPRRPRDAGQPPIPLVLHYLITAYSAQDKYEEDSEIVAHEILGDAIRVFYDNAIIEDSTLLHSSLQDQLEKINITLEPLNVEELTKIWMGFNSPYRLSVGYAVSVVQIESQRTRPIPRPVRTRRLRLSQLRRPRILEVLVSAPATDDLVLPPSIARVGDRLQIRGFGLAGLSTTLLIGGSSMSVAPVSDALIDIVLPQKLTSVATNAEVPVPPGTTDLSVSVQLPAEILEATLGGPALPGSATQQAISNHVPLMIAPKIAAITPVEGKETDVISISGEALYVAGRDAEVLLGDAAIPIGAVQGVEPTPERVQATLTALPALPAGVYDVRVRANGAESLEVKEFTLKS